MMKRIYIFVFMIAACDKKEPPAPLAATSASVATAATGDTSASRENKRHRCPTDVEGATTAVADVDGGVQLTITSANAASMVEIRSRSNRIVEIAQRFADAGRQDHAERAEHRMGRCAAIVIGAQADEKDVDGGAQLTILATTPSDVARVRSEVHDRLTK